MDATRDRIVRAAFELHQERGPAYATISAIAKRARVERHTVYRHFPDLVALMRACTEHGMRTTGLPDPDIWRSLDDPYQRLHTALTAMYRYWRANQRLIANILRDSPVMPELVEGSAAYQDHLGHGQRRVDDHRTQQVRDDVARNDACGACATDDRGFDKFTLAQCQGLATHDARHRQPTEGADRDQ